MFQSNHNSEQISSKKFYEIYKNLPKTTKRILRSIITAKCRVSEITVRDWLAKESIPFYQSNRIHEIITEMIKDGTITILSLPITEEELFPEYKDDLKYA